MTVLDTSNVDYLGPVLILITKTISYSQLMYKHKLIKLMQVQKLKFFHESTTYTYLVAYLCGGDESCPDISVALF